MIANDAELAARIRTAAAEIARDANLLSVRGWKVDVWIISTTTRGDGLPLGYESTVSIQRGRPEEL
jgi:hypothetical protein